MEPGSDCLTSPGKRKSTNMETDHTRVCPFFQAWRTCKAHCAPLRPAGTWCPLAEAVCAAAAEISLAAVWARQRAQQSRASHARPDASPGLQ